MDNYIQYCMPTALLENNEFHQMYNGHRGVWTMLKISIISVVAVCVFVSCTDPSVERKLSVPVLFSDRMVLQQGRDLLIWGWAKPGREVEVKFRQQNVSAGVNADARWKVVLKPENAGSPDSLIIGSGDEKLVFHDVLVGEVWLCSGQSNMEMPLTGFLPGDPIRDSEKEIENANYPNLRLFTVKRDISFTPKNDCTGQWQTCNPQTAKWFSATAYFFGRMIHKELNVPVGLIHSSWGGTPVQSWMDIKHLSAFSEFDSVLKDIRASETKIKILEDWLDQRSKIVVDNEKDDKWASLNFNDAQLADPAFDDREWETMELPRTWETSELGQFDGVLWFRKKVDLPIEMMDTDLKLELGPIDDMDISYFNGVIIGETQKEGFWKMNRIYTIPGNLVKEKDNVIAVRVMDHQGGGGIFGEREQMKIYNDAKPDRKLMVAGDWKYLPVAEYRGGTFYLFDIETRQYYQRPKLPVALGPHTPTTLYHAMINPLVPYAIQGAIWYQGEANTGNPKQYTYLFPALIDNWRTAWEQGDFPFYFVQIAPYDYGIGTHSQELREAQMKTLQVAHTGMAVTVDIGNPENIHPANKQEVGRRLALWALAKTYGKDVVFSGPLYRSMETAGNTIILSFDHVNGGLISKRKEPDHFLIAGSDRIFKKAYAVIRDSVVVVSHPAVTDPVAVRYLWDNTSDASLFNKAGLPASSFRTDDWED